MEKYNVIYHVTNDDGTDTKIEQSLSQKDLANLLMRRNVILSSVNANKSIYRSKRKK